jgi:hypothetical protein
MANLRTDTDGGRLFLYISLLGLPSEAPFFDYNCRMIWSYIIDDGGDNAVCPYDGFRRRSEICDRSAVRR